jgi:ABC-2 type transport system ATP-binding protein
MPEVERVCDRVAIIREGIVVTVEDVATLKSHAVRRLEIHFAEPVTTERFGGIAGVGDISAEGNVLSCTVVGELDGLVKAAAELHVVNIISQEPSLEDVFLTYYQGGDDAV